MRGRDAANILKPALARGVALRRGHNPSTSIAKKIEKDGALARRFDLVVVKESTDEAMLVILRGIRPRYEVYFRGGRFRQMKPLRAAVKLAALFTGALLAR